MLTQTQLQLADALDEMPVGQTLEIHTGDFIKRESPERYVINEELKRNCMMEVVLRFKE